MLFSYSLVKSSPLAKPYLIHFLYNNKKATPELGRLFSLI